MKHDEDTHFGGWINAVSAKDYEFRESSPEGNYGLALLLIAADVNISLIIVLDCVEL